jgi:hypothetical protein
MATAAQRRVRNIDRTGFREPVLDMFIKEFC